MKRMILGMLLLGSLPAWGAGYTRNVAIVLYDGVELLDFAGPTEVFAAAAGFGAAGAPDAPKPSRSSPSPRPTTR